VTELHPKKKLLEPLSSECISLIMLFLTASDQTPLLVLNKKWLDLLINHIKNKISGSQKAVLQCKIFEPTPTTLDTLLAEACLAATLLSSYQAWWSSSEEKQYRLKAFKHVSENYIYAISTFFSLDKQKADPSITRHLRRSETQLYPSLKRYHASASQAFQALFQQQTGTAPQHSHSSCTIT